VPVLYPNLEPLRTGAPDQGPQPGGSPHAEPNVARAATPSRIAVRCHALRTSVAAIGAGAVSARKSSIAFAIASASPRDGVGVTSSILGRLGRRLPSLLMAGL
jgi:hypothetical protein